MVRKQLGTAVDRLTGDRSDESIHETRKSIKKVRAVLQLLGDDLGANGAVKDLRRASHLLSPLRDMDAMIETARSLGSGAVDRTASAAFDTHLLAEKAKLRQTADHGGIGPKAAHALERVRRDSRHWHWKRTNWSALATAIKRSYKRARKDMQSLRDESNPDAFHEWRKRVKTLWYGLRLLEGRARRLRRTVADFKRLETLLGEDHNLLVLHAQVRSAASSRLPARGRAHLRTRMERRQHQLQHQALALGARLLAQSPKAFSKRLREMWSATRAPQRSSAAA